MQAHAVIGREGAYEALAALADSSLPDLDAGHLEARMRSVGVSDAPAVLGELAGANLVRRTRRGYAITHSGRRTRLLVEAMAGGDLRDIYRRLARLDGLEQYELVREGMTSEFLESFVSRPGFGTLYICSPWINLDARAKGLLTAAVVRMEERRRERPQIFALMRPMEGTRDRPPDEARYLQSIGASVYLHPRLHSKLYMREPGTAGGMAMAIVGSQNLTRSSYLELGIRINGDTQMMTRLAQYFWEVTYSSVEVT
jgi:hypothetical protein